MIDLRNVAERLLESPMRAAIVDLLTSLPHIPGPETSITRTRGMTASEIGEELGIHASTARFHLDQLIASGLVEFHDERGQVGRPRRCYRILAMPSSEVLASDAHKHFAALLDDVVNDHGEVDGEMLGQAWARDHIADILDPVSVGSWPQHPATSRCEWFGKLGALVDAMDDWGYQPEVSTSHSGHRAELRLLACPMRAAADANPELICAAHAGVLRVLLDSLGEQEAQLSVTRAPAPQYCRAVTTTSNDLVLTTHRRMPAQSKGTSS